MRPEKLAKTTDLINKVSTSASYEWCHTDGVLCTKKECSNYCKACFARLLPIVVKKNKSLLFLNIINQKLKRGFSVHVIFKVTRE